MFPDFDDNLRAAYKKEVELFFGSIVHEDRSIMDLLTGDYTYVNERLAKHYGIANVYGPQFRRVQSDARAGYAPRLAGQGALLTATSNAARTSPVARASGICRRSSALARRTRRQMFRPSRKLLPIRPGTAGFRRCAKRWRCTRRIRRARRATRSLNPWACALENFDAVGAWRTMDGAAPIDPNGVMVDGTKLEGVQSLRGVLVGRSDQFARVVAEKMMIYALRPRRGVSRHAGSPVHRA